MHEADLELLVAVLLMVVAILQIFALHYADKMRKKISGNDESERSYVFSMATLAASFLTLITVRGNRSDVSKGLAASAAGVGLLVLTILNIVSLVYSVRTKNLMDDKDARLVVTADALSLVGVVIAAGAVMMNGSRYSGSYSR